MNNNSLGIHIDAYYRSLNKYKEELCGDRVQIKRSDRCLVMVLADGLGSGVKANILSTLTSTIISEMIFSGMSLQDAVETITATLPVCSERGIAYSTFTIIQVFYNTNCYIAQFDNPSIVLLRNNQVVDLEKEEHIINDKKIYISKTHVKPDDRLVTFSDGVLHAGVGMTLNFGWGQEEVEHFLSTRTRSEDDARETTRLLLTNVNYLYGGKPGDDSTVACLKIVQAKETRVMVGPPTNKEDDQKVVDKLLDATGYKICCGGTTSQIVSRITNRELTTDLTQEILAYDVPPTGKIEGIDLVTEGVITLQRVSRYIRNATKSFEQVEEFLLSNEKDGATLLTKMLLESTQITFMVGLSDNPAHDAIAYSPISLNAKIKIIKEMQENLKRLGKIVTIEMY